MKNKAPLSLMEQLMMLLVFALAAALCLQVFSVSSRESRRIEARTGAVAMVQNTAETVKASKGDISQYPLLLGGAGDGESWEICYDETWSETIPEQAGYHIRIIPQKTSLPTLGRATVSAFAETEEDALFSVTVSWQEVAHE